MPDLNRAIRRAREWLLSQQDSDGAWRDFDDMPVGPAATWTSAVALLALTETRSSPDAVPAIARASAFVASRQLACGGWSYNEAVGPDADTSAHCMIALSRASRPMRRRAAARHLTEYRTPDGRIGTFRRTHPKASWSQAHDEVGAVVAIALSDPALACAVTQATASQVEQTRFVPCFWWASAAYTTYALSWCSTQVLGRCMELSCKPSPNASSPAVETAWYGLAAIFNDDAVAALGAVARLADTQNADGSFANSALLRMTDGDSVASWNESGIASGPTFRDRRAVYSTAVALRCLSAYMERYGH